MTSRYEGIQNKLWGMREGCFFLSLLSIAEEYNGRKVDLIDAVNKAFKEKWVKSDYTVLDDCALLRWLTGKPVKKIVLDYCYALRGNQYSIAKYISRDKLSNHFRRRYFDVYENSLTVREGTLVCYYIYTIG